MALQQGTETVSLITSERCFRFEVEAPLGGDPCIAGHREIVKSAGGAVIAQAVTEPTRRFLSKVADQVVTIPGTDQTVTVAQIADMIFELTDRWRTEDIAREAEIAPLRTMTIRPRPDVQLK
jgi:hypothetical protein